VIFLALALPHAPAYRVAHDEEKAAIDAEG
jgi:hypothetical protein